MAAKRTNAEYLIVAEYRMLNALINSPIFIEDSRIHEGTFPHVIAQSLYTAIRELKDRDIEITPASLYQKANEIDYNVNMDVINQIFTIDSGANKLDDIIEVLNRARQKAELQNKVNELSYLANTHDELDSSQISSKLYEAEQLLAQTTDKQILRDFDSWFEKYIDDLKGRIYKKRYPFGDLLLDKLLVKGAYPGAMTLIAGATGQGKSAYVLNIINGMVNQNIPCMYISLEMSDIDTMDRLVSLRREIPTEELYTPGEGMEAVIKVVEEERKKLVKDGKLFYFVDEPNLSIAQVHALIKEFKQRTRADYAVVAIDLVTQLKEFTKVTGGMNLANAIEVAMNQLNAIAKSENVHFLLVAQFGRDADKMKITDMEDLVMLRPSLNDVKNSNAIGERCRAVLGIFRAKYYADRYLQDDEKTAYMDDIMEVNVLKQNNGMVGRMKYLYDGQIFRVTPILTNDEDTDQSSDENSEIRDAESHIGNF